MNRTLHAVRRQLSVMRCERFEVGVRQQANGRMMNRVWSSGEIVKNVQWLKRMNADDNDLYIRPCRASCRESRLVLIDDVTRDAVSRMMASGHEPTLVVETSPENYQVWIRVPYVAEDALITQLARRLAERYQGDQNSANHRHYGRLAGFTNRKPERRTSAGPPWVLLRHSSTQAPTRGHLLLDGIRMAGASRKSRGPQGRRCIAVASRTNRNVARAHAAFRNQVDRLARIYGAQLDQSRADWAALRVLAAMGFEEATLKEVLHVQSQNLEERKRGHVEDYIERTVAKIVRIYGR